MKTLSQRQEERRKLQLELMEQQIKEGTLVVRQMTPEERAKVPQRTEAQAKAHAKAKAKTRAQAKARRRS